MKNSKLTLLFLSIILLIISCEKENLNPPTLSLKTENGYISENIEISSGEQFTIGIVANSNGDDALTNLKITSNETIVIADEGINQHSIDKDYVITKNSLETETIKILVSDINGKKAELSLTITKKGENWGNIITYTCQIRAQDNTEIGAFASLQNGNVYSIMDAFNNRSIIDLCYFYDNADLAVIASPGANLDGIYTGTFNPEDWETRRTTRFSRSPVNISVSDFDNMENDQLIIENMTSESEGGRKAKNLKADDIYAFITEDGKNGLLKVVSQSGTSEGNIEIVAKIQE